MSPEYKNAYSKKQFEEKFQEKEDSSSGISATVTVMSGIDISTTLQFTNGVLVSSLSGAV